MWHFSLLCDSAIKGFCADKKHFRHSGIGGKRAFIGIALDFDTVQEADDNSG